MDLMKSTKKNRNNLLNVGHDIKDSGKKKKKTFIAEFDLNVALLRPFVYLQNILYRYRNIFLKLIHFSKRNKPLYVHNHSASIILLGLNFFTYFMHLAFSNKTDTFTRIERSFSYYNAIKYLVANN